jgi:hypothetical protein
MLKTDRIGPNKKKVGPHPCLHQRAFKKRRRLKKEEEASETNKSDIHF